MVQRRAAITVTLGFAKLRWSAWVATAVALVLTGLDIATTHPPFPPVLTLRLTLPTGIAGRFEPLVTTGYVTGCNNLVIGYYGPQSAVLIYDAEGFVVSSPHLEYEPGATYDFRLEMPSITHAGATGPPGRGQLLVTLQGKEMLRGEVTYHPCDAGRVFFARNPAGGSTMGKLFRGKITTLHGTELRGRPAALFSTADRCSAWLRTKWWHLIPLGLTALAIRRATARLGARAASDPAVRARWAAHAWFAASSALCLWIFIWLITSGTFYLAFPDAFPVYDFQARSLLQGRLDIPRELVAGEAFIVGDKAYAYFGPTPALLRLPFVAADAGFTHLARGFMLAEYAAALVAAYLILGDAVRRCHGAAAIPSAWAIVLMTAAAGLGSTLLFLASRAYPYHEAILCGAAFGLWSGYFALRHLDRPHERWWLGALLCGTFAVQARAPAGLFALGLLGAIALLHLRPQSPGSRVWRRHALIAGAAIAAFFTLPAISYAKFGTIDGNPLRLNPQYTPERMAKIEGRSFHLANAPHNFAAYLLRPAFRASAHFPFFQFDLDRREFAGAKIDLEEPTVALPYATAGLVALATGACLAAGWRPAPRLPLLVVAGAALPLFACLVTFIATSHRYTGDFCPPLILAAAYGLAIFDRERPLRRCGWLGAASATTAFAFVLTLGLSFHFQTELVWGVTEDVKANLQKLQERTDHWFDVTPP